MRRPSQGDDYAPVAYDFLYQGLLLLDDASYSNDYGTYSPVKYGVGHLTELVRVNYDPRNFRVMITDILLSNPGNATSNYVYTQSRNGAALDGVGLSFYTNDDFGPLFSLVFNTTSGAYQDTTQEQLGAELLQMMDLAPIDRSVGVPQCSFLDLPAVVSPNSSLANSTVCSSAADALMWGDDVASDEFYNTDGEWSNAFYLITLSPFNTGPQFSSISQLALGLLQNANVFAHIRMAVYDSNNTLMAGSNEVAVDNSRDDVLYFTLDRPVTLYPASTYYAAYWSDVSLYTPAGQDYTALCYYGLQYGYDLEPWPQTIGSVEAEFEECHPLPTAALGCVTAAIPPGPTEVCYLVYPSSTGGGQPALPTSTPAPTAMVTSAPAPTSGPYVPASTAAPAPTPEVEKEGVAMSTLVTVVLLTIALTAALTVLAMRMIQQGKCARFGLRGAGASDDGGAILGGVSDTSSSSRYSSMRD